MANVFDFINSINAEAKEDMFRTHPEGRDVADKEYVPYIVNRGMSLFQDTVLYANEVNQLAHIDKIAQYDFYRLSIRPRKRWSKWPKYIQNDDLEMLKKYFQYSTQKASVALKALTEEQLDKIRETVTDLDNGIMK